MIKQRKRTRAQRTQDNTAAFWASKIPQDAGPKERAKVLWDRLLHETKNMDGQPEAEEVWGCIERTLENLIREIRQK